MESDIIRTISKSQQIIEKLRSLLNQGEYKPGDKFLSEHALAKKYGVTQGTMNKITSHLVAEGLLMRKQGAGTFVKHTKSLNFYMFLEKPLHTFSSGHAGIAFHDMEIIQGIIEESNKSDIKTNFLPTYTEDGLDAVLKNIKKNEIKADGYIFYEWSGFEKLIGKLEEAGVSYVAADFIREGNESTVLIDRKAAISKVMNILSGKGIKKIGYLGEIKDDYSRLKFGAFNEAVLKYGFTKDESSILSGYRAGTFIELTEEAVGKMKTDITALIGRGVEAVFVEKTEYLPVLLEVLKKLNRSDIALFVYNRIPPEAKYGGYMVYIKTDYTELGRETVRMLCRKTEGDKSSKTYLLPEIVELKDGV